MKLSHFIIVAGLLGIVAGITLLSYLQPVQKDELIGFAEKIPLNVNTYCGRDVPLEKRIYEMLETNNVIMRFYDTKDKPEVLFYFIYDSGTYKTADPPENCVQGDGFTVLKKERKILSIPYGDKHYELPVNVMLVERQKERQVFVYWFLAGDRFYDSYVQQRRRLISAYLSMRPLGGGQARISTQVYGNDAEEALGRISDFITAMLPYITKFLKLHEK
ncbi:MAG: EpsI family protein [Candidatus Omnitrophica bacterium]|nr:EpsI family protein [Candidatus Omnitrophota bacterium]